MPLLRIDAYSHRTETEITQVLDGIHRAVLYAFQVPARDRYQIYQEHAASHMIAEDTGLDIPRTEKLLIISMTSRPRPEEQKRRFYEKLVEELGACGILPSDVMVSITTNTDADWSFGLGRAQFLTGEL